MIRFFERNVFWKEYETLDMEQLYSFFQKNSKDDIICVRNKDRYIGMITYDSFQKKEDIFRCITDDYLILNGEIWNSGRRCFQEKNRTFIPVFNQEYQLLGFAWQDKRADKELRMLEELEMCSDAVTFGDMNPECRNVTIHGCNELAWYFKEYLEKRNIAVNVEGRLWREFGIQERQETCNFSDYEIWAEGVHPKSGNWKQERLRTVSVEFECLDQIYEENIIKGKISDADGSVDKLVKKLRQAKGIVIRGVGTKAQDAYDWLLSEGIDVCAFQSRHVSRKSLFGKPIMAKEDIKIHFPDAVILECSAKHSAWGFGEVDAYNNEGYKRNQRYFLLRDYIDVPQINLINIVKDKNLIFIGNPALCKNAYRWWKRHGMGVKEIYYWDVLGMEKEEAEQLNLPLINGEALRANSIYLLFLPTYSYKGYVTKKMQTQYMSYVDNLNLSGIYDYTDYFLDIAKSVSMNMEKEKYICSDLQPGGILLGAIPTHSGNTLIKQSLAGHPQIMVIEEYNYFNTGLYMICIRLAEKKADSILLDFWKIYSDEAGPDSILKDFPDAEKFNRKMNQLLKLSDHFTSQELFVMLHMAYEAMYGRDVQKTVIYWEPHNWDTNVERTWAQWLYDDDIHGLTITMVRNRCVHAGSCMRSSSLRWASIWGITYNPYLAIKGQYKNWKDKVIKFEDLKRNPKEILNELCEDLGIPFHNNLMETTCHGQKGYYLGVTGFDMRPVYNLYEEYFTELDRMKISMLAASYQKEYGYPYINCSEFTRRELQELYLKDFRYEKELKLKEEKKESMIWDEQNIFSELLWIERFAEVMRVKIEERFGLAFS